jgi:hypothetical protein
MQDFLMFFNHRTLFYHSRSTINLKENLMFRIGLITVTAILFLSCGASKDPALVGRINSWSAGNSGKSFSMTGKFTKPIPYAVGQYVVHSITSGEDRSISKTSIVGQEQGGWILETYSLSPYNESTSQMLVTGLDRVHETGNIDDLDIIWVKMKQKDQDIQMIEGPVLSLTKGLYRDLLGGFSLKMAVMNDGGTISVPAGTFSGTSRMVSEVRFLGSSYTAEGWYHSEVPINACVRSVSKENDSVMELLEFSLSGAKRSF